MRVVGRTRCPVARACRVLPVSALPTSSCSPNSGARSIRGVENTAADALETLNRTVLGLPVIRIAPDVLDT
jgi:hypothetical protein